MKATPLIHPKAPSGRKPGGGRVLQYDGRSLQVVSVQKIFTPDSLSLDLAGADLFVYPGDLLAVTLTTATSGHDFFSASRWLGDEADRPHRVTYRPLTRS